MSTDLLALRRTPGFKPHRHGPNPEHVHADRWHEVYSHRHQYYTQDIGAVGTYTASLWRELRDNGKDEFGPEHWHLDHKEEK